MVRVRYNPLVESMHGRVGQLVLQDIQRTHAGRRYVNPRYQNTDRQQRSRGNMRNASRLWSQIPDSGREMWGYESLRTGRQARQMWIQQYCTSQLGGVDLSQRPLFSRQGTRLAITTITNATTSAGNIVIQTSLADVPAGWTKRNLHAIAAPDHDTSTPTPPLSGEWRSASTTGSTITIEEPEPSDLDRSAIWVWTDFTVADVGILVGTGDYDAVPHSSP